MNNMNNIELHKIDLPYSDIMSDFNIDKCANQIKKLMNSDLKQIETKMISYFETNYSEKKYYSKCISIYQNVLNS